MFQRANHSIIHLMEDIFLHNTLSGKKEKFEPIQKGKVKIYSCGPTVYDYAHIGNFRSFLLSDLLTRVLKYAGYETTTVMNITDVGHLTNDESADADGEDKISKKAKAEKIDPFQIARTYEKAFLEDADVLRMQPANFYPRATDYIQEQIDLAQKLIEERYAYEVNGSVYFRTTKYEKYGQLSKNKLEDLKAGARVEVNSEKENPLDFALWKRADKNHLMQWEFLTGKQIPAKIIEKYATTEFSSKSAKFEELKQDFRESYEVIRRANPELSDEEIGKILEKNRGFPGWHIECSAMSRKILGDHFDIHTGGEDNIFPHHECEIAQNECSNGGKKSVNYWLHVKHLLVNGKKMSKSAGNFYTIRDLLEKGWKGEEIRFALLGAHYRSTLDFSEDSLVQARSSIARIREAHRIFKHLGQGSSAGTFGEQFKQSYKYTILDDLNVSKALASVFNLINEGMKARDLGMEKNQAKSIANFLEEDFNQVFDVLFEEQDLKDDQKAVIETLVQTRQKAREEKDWAKSDQIRDELLKKFNVEVRDGPDGQTWHLK